MSEKLFSIIVPIYNAEKYLEECVESYAKYVKDTDGEIILIDDGSSDDSAKICDKLHEKYEFVVVSHQANSGVAVARNNGIKIAKGKYILFADSDDYCNSNIVDLFESLKTETCDLVCSNSYHVLGEKTELKGGIKHDQILHSGEKKFYKYLGNGITNNVWDKAFLKSKIVENNIEFSRYRNAEDMLFVLKYVSNCNTIKLREKPYYHYVIRENSAMTSMNKEKVFDGFNACKEGIEYAGSMPKKIRIELEKYSCRTAFFTLKMCVKADKNDRSELVDFVKTNKQLFKRISNLKTFVTNVSLKLFGVKNTLKLLDLIF